MSLQDALGGMRFGARDIVLTRLNRGRDGAISIGAIAEATHLSRRAVEKAVQELRVDGWAISSGSDGIWLADLEDMHRTIDSLQRRLAQQYLTLRALRDTEKRMARAAYPAEQLVAFVDLAS